MPNDNNDFLDLLDTSESCECVLVDRPAPPFVEKKIMVCMCDVCRCYNKYLDLLKQAEKGSPMLEDNAYTELERLHEQQKSLNNTINGLKNKVKQLEDQKKSVIADYNILQNAYSQLKGDVDSGGTFEYVRRLELARREIAELRKEVKKECADPVYVAGLPSLADYAGSWYPPTNE